MLSRKVKRGAKRLLRMAASHGVALHPHDRRLMAYKSAYKGEVAYILGNGPSVRLADLEQLNNRLSFAMNRFHLSYAKHAFKPRYTVCVDDAMLEQHGEEIARECQSPLFMPEAFVGSGMPWTAAGNIVPFLYQPAGNGAVRLSDNPFTGVQDGASVVFVAMQLAVWMGAKTLVLYGVDHSFALPADYQGAGKTVTDQGEQNHFISGYRDKGEKWYPPDVAKIEAGFSAAKAYGDAHGVRMLNATHGGKLEIFERIPFVDALSL